MKSIRKDAPNGHLWKKTNLVTLYKNKKHFDEYTCANCGLKGKSFNLVTIEFLDSVNDNLIDVCPNSKPESLPKKIKITRCYAVGSQFENLVPNSEHLVITPPAGFKNDRSGVWVMGNGEPVKVLRSEFIIIE